MSQWFDFALQFDVFGLLQDLGRRDSYRGAVKDKKMGDNEAEGSGAAAAAAAKKKKGNKKEEMEDLKKELTLDDHVITWEEFHVRHEGSNRTTVRDVTPFHFLTNHFRSFITSSCLHNFERIILM